MLLIDVRTVLTDIAGSCAFPCAGGGDGTAMSLIIHTRATGEETRRCWWIPALCAVVICPYSRIGHDLSITIPYLMSYAVLATDCNVRKAAAHEHCPIEAWRPCEEQCVASAQYGYK